MNKKYLGILCAGALTLGPGSAAQAALYDRGNGMIYDSDQDLTWLQNANLAAGNIFGLGYNTDLGDHPGDSWGSNYQETIWPNGVMSWGGALHWIDAMNAANYKGYGDWRLPAITDMGAPGCDHASVGTDCGYNVDTSGSEPAYLWYDILGNIPYEDSDGNYPQPGWGLYHKGADGANFHYLQPYSYWSGTEYAPDSGDAWFFDANYGYQGRVDKDRMFYAMAVRSGDVAPVPLPAAVWLFGAGLAGLGLLGGAKRRR
ncbi:MAG TPA: DUF1566 domain-containing protein [Sedimenticola sp.]|nr:DUF1566 domain-containing protein [Sedimenticola sp.]